MVRGEGTMAETIATPAPCKVCRAAEHVTNGLACAICGATHGSPVTRPDGTVLTRNGKPVTATIVHAIVERKGGKGKDGRWANPRGGWIATALCEADRREVIELRRAEGGSFLRFYALQDAEREIAARRERDREFEEARKARSDRLARFVQRVCPTPNR